MNESGALVHCWLGTCSRPFYLSIRIESHRLHRLPSWGVIYAVLSILLCTTRFESSKIFYCFKWHCSCILLPSRAWRAMRCHTKSVSSLHCHRRPEIVPFLKRLILHVSNIWRCLWISWLFDTSVSILILSWLEQAFSVHICFRPSMQHANIYTQITCIEVSSFTYFQKLYLMC